VYRDSFEDSLANLGKVLSRCQEKTLTLNWKKCHFMVKKRIVLGHIFSIDSIEVDKVRVDLIGNLPLPTCVTDIRSFLGHASFYWRFIKHFRKIGKPLSSILAMETPFHFSKECEVTFTKLKEALNTAPILHPPI